jgi:hypothetical protein
MGDSPKRPDNASWTELEQSFFASGSPDEPEPLGEALRVDDLLPTPAQPPARESFTWLRSSMVAVWRRANVFGAANALVAALSIRSIDRRRLAFASVRTILMMGIFAAIVASRTGVSTKVTTAKTEAPASRPAAIQAAPAALISASGVAVQQNVRSTANVRPPGADASNRAPRAHRKPAPAPSSAKRPLITVFVDRETYWARQGQSAPARSGRPLFSR